MPVAATGISAGFDHSLIGLGLQWDDAKSAGVVHLPFGKAEANARQALGHPEALISRRGVGYLLQMQAVQDAAFIKALDGLRKRIQSEPATRAAAIPSDWKKYAADLDTIKKRFGAMSPDASDAAQTWLRSGVLDPSFAVGQRKAITAKDFAAVTPYLQFVTRGDDKVRENHAALDEFIAATSSDVWAEECAPPLGWNCRCRVIPIPWRTAVRLGFSTVYPRGTSKLQAFRSLGGADPKFPRDLFRLSAL